MNAAGECREPNDSDRMDDSKRCSDGDDVSSLLALAEELGLDAVGVASAEPFAEARAELEARRSRGLASTMQFTYRNPARSCDPSATLAGAKSLIVGALRYEGGEGSGSGGRTGSRNGGGTGSGGGVTGETASGTGGETAGEAEREIAKEKMFAKVAAYAQRDYHADLRSALEEIAKRLRDDGHEARVVADDNALMDREAARRAGLGWYGKNTCLLIPRKGSRFVLGSVITTAVFAPSEPVERTCGTCSLCQQACPTGALDVAGQLDARRCLAWLLQAEGIFPREHRAALGNRFYGCDDCQDVCPINSRQSALHSIRSTNSKQSADETSHANEMGEEIRLLRTNSKQSADETSPEQLSKQLGDEDLEFQSDSAIDILAASDEELMDRYGRFYIPRRQPRYLRRNALLVLANTTSAGGEPSTEWALRDYIGHEDPMLRAHGVWAAQRLGRFDLAENAHCDPDARVREEARRPVLLNSRSPGLLADRNAEPLANHHPEPLANRNAEPPGNHHPEPLAEMPA